MTDTPASPNISIAKGIAALPFKAFLLLVKHPFLVAFIALLLMWGTISGLALFNPAISERFNNAVAYFGLATVASEVSDIWRKKLADKDTDLKTSRDDLDAAHKKNSRLQLDAKEKNTLLRSKSAKIDKLNSAIESKNTVLRNSAKELKNAAKVLKVTSNDLRAKTQLLNSMNSKITTFRQTGKKIEFGVKKRFTKVAIYDAAGEFLGWFPFLGDAASLGLAAGGIHEMCQMFKEIEQATTDLGVPYQVYTDTFCEKPVEKSAEIISETTDKAKETVGERITNTKIYWSTIYKEHF